MLNNYLYNNDLLPTLAAVAVAGEKKHVCAYFFNACYRKQQYNFPRPNQ
jgi:hypothetical protein